RSGPPRGEAGLPGLARRRSARAGLAIEGQYLVGHVEGGLEWPAEVLLGGLHLVWAERRAVRLGGVLTIRRAVPDVRAHGDDRGSLSLGFGGHDGRVEGLEIVGV